MICDIQPKFITIVSDLFFKNGPKNLTMDDIAKEFGMSKKTLYLSYKTKEELLEMVLNEKLDKISAKIFESQKTSKNAIENLIVNDEGLEEFNHHNKSLFYKQLHKYYPTVFNQHILYTYTKFSEILKENIRQGREEKLYREDFDDVFYSKIFITLMSSFDTSPLFDSDEFDIVTYCRNCKILFVHSICTEKGTNILNKLKS